MAVNRRDLVKTGGVLAMVPMASAALADGRYVIGKRVDVVVVGAGFAGLTAATTLARAGKSVLVLEQLDRVGGRTKPGKLAGHTVDIGGQWVGPTQTALLGLGKRYGVQTEEQYVSGDGVMVANGNPTRFAGSVPSLEPADLAQLGNAIAQIDQAAAALDAARPWASKDAERLDAITSRAWFEANVPSRPAREVLELFWRVVYSVEANEVSHLFALEYVRAAGGVAQLIGTRGAAQDATFVGGVHQIADKMAATLGGRVRLGTRVIGISQDSKGVRVRCADGEIAADRVVLALPPSAVARLAATPDLPPMHRFIANRMPLGSVIKFLVAYPTPFWRARGLSGLVVDPAGPVKVILDKTLPGGAGGLVGFFNGADAARASLLTAAQRRDLVVAHAVRHLGPEAARPLDYIDNDWLAEEGIGGGYTSIPGIGVFCRAGGALREPHGRIHFAGTETSDTWPGYIDGAVRSGERAAAEILKR